MKWPNDTLYIITSTCTSVLKYISSQVHVHMFIHAVLSDKLTQNQMRKCVFKKKTLATTMLNIFLKTW